MATSVPRPNSVVLGVVVLAVALAVLLLVRPERSAAAHEDCTLSTGAPVSYAGIFAIGGGSVDCATTKNVIRVSAFLTMDGAFMDSIERTCHKRATCPTNVFVNDPPGDQVWCNTASGRVGAHSLPEVTHCETEASP
jgi:hypothetical protein